MTRAYSKEQVRKWRADYIARKIKAGECLYSGCHASARPSRRYCKKHATREQRGMA